MNTSRREPVRHVSRSPEQTWEIARALVEGAAPRTIIALHGDLGSGKTCFVQGIALALGIRQPVVSPTFTLIREYRGTRPLRHMDLYRISGSLEALGLGFEEYIEADGITAIEWAERAADVLPRGTIHVRMEATANPDERVIVIE